MSVRPLFLLSLPRSGSTLVQRVLAAHEGIATAPEPWVALPPLYATRDRGAYTEYGQALAARAIRDFAGALPGGEADYWAEVRSFLMALYGRASGPEAVYFVDKTPRYHFIADDLFRIFPESRFVFLWRNPLSVVASTVDTWGRGKWKVGRWRVDLFDGLAHLVSSWERNAGAALAVRYEDLVSAPEASWPRVFEYLELPFDPAVLTSFGSVQVQARMGDPTGRRAYGALSTGSVYKWKTTLANPFRKRWCRDYLRWIGRERLAIMGYLLDDLLAELDALPSHPRSVGSDLVRATHTWLLRTGRETGGRLLWKTSRGGDARSLYEERSKGQTSSP